MLFFPTVDEDVQYFRSQGYTGSINDMHFKAMGDLGYTGSLSDRIHSFLVSEYGSFYESMRDLRNTTASFVALRYGVDAIQPELVLDFGEEYYRVDGGKTTLTSAVTHSRASNATMTDSDGVLKWAPHNLLTYSEDFSNAAWGGSTATIVTGVADNVGGVTGATVTATGTLQTFRQSSVSVSGTTTTQGIYMRRRTGSGGIQFYNGATYDTITLSAEYQLVTADTTSTNYLIRIAVSGDEIDVCFAHTYRSDLGGMVNNPETGNSYVPTTTAAVYMPRVGHHIYDGYEWVNEGILHESEARTNLLLNSGTLSTQSATVAAAPNTLSFTGTGTVTLTGASTAGPLVGTGTGENNRVNLTFTPTAGTLTLTVTGTVTNAQLEAGSTPSSYIPTAGATVTRAAETLTVPAANMPDYMTPTYIGGELVANGTFDSDTAWTKTTGWTILGGKATHSQSSGGGELYQEFNIVAGNTYVMSFTIDTTGDTLISNTSIGLRTTGGSYLASIASSGGVGSIAANTAGQKFGITYTATSTQTIRARMFSDDDISIDNISVKEINPLSVSIQMQGKMTYADGGSFTDGVFLGWYAAGTEFITYRAGGYNADSGKVYFVQNDAGVQDVVASSNGVIAEGVFSPFNLSARHGSTFINGAVDGTALTANTTPTGIPDLSATDFGIGTTFNGTIKSLRVWGEDISDTGIAAASAPTFTDEFAMTVTTTTANETFTIPCQNEGTFNAGIQWGDGSVSTVTAYNDAKLTHTFATAGDHLIRIRGSFPNINFNNAGDKLKVKSVDNLGIVGWTRFDLAFYGCSNMTSFTAGTTDTSAVTNMSYMFRGCSSLTSLNVSGFNTATVTNMSQMFRDCSSLTSLDVSSFNTTAVVNMSAMFNACNSLTALDLSSFNTAVVTNMTAMFYNCSSLPSLDLSSFNTAAVTFMDYMFYNCSSITALDVSSFNTAAAQNMANMFQNCSSLTSLDLSNFNTAAVKNMNSMFNACTSLTSLDVSNFNTTAVTAMNYMFYNCSSLTALDLSSFNTAVVTNMTGMFYNCSSITDILGVEDFNIEGLNTISDLNSFMTNVTLPTARYDALLINWDAQEAFDAMLPNFGLSTYTGGGTAAAARANLISTDLWAITDGGIA